ncbi:MAG: hypothetical protein COB36_02425 [Alphaproteobacteria bacterium]|nr:MAG: hypothetical protein COB36_02425 [Alphaproteobacteria bacterium]
MSIKPEDLKLEEIHNTVASLKDWAGGLTDVNVSPESVAAIYNEEYAELKGTLASESVFTNAGITNYFEKLLDKTYDGQIGVTFNSIAPNADYDGCVGHYTFSFLNKDQEKTDLHATFEFKASKDSNGLTYHHSYKAEETPKELEDQLPDDYQSFEGDEPDALDSIDLG